MNKPCICLSSASRLARSVASSAMTITESKNAVHCVAQHASDFSASV